MSGTPGYAKNVDFCDKGVAGMDDFAVRQSFIGEEESGGGRGQVESCPNNFVSLTLSIGFHCLLVQGQPARIKHYSLHSMLDWRNMLSLIMSGSLSH